MDEGNDIDERIKVLKVANGVIGRLEIFGGGMIELEVVGREERGRVELGALPTPEADDGGVDIGGETSEGLMKASKSLLEPEEVIEPAKV